MSAPDPGIAETPQRAPRDQPQLAAPWRGGGGGGSEVRRCPSSDRRGGSRAPRTDLRATARLPAAAVAASGLDVLLLLVNWIAAFFMSPEPRPAVSYTFFLSQVSASNVELITSRGRRGGELQEARLLRTAPGRAGAGRDPLHDAAADVRQRQPVPAAAEHRCTDQRQPAGRRPAVVATAAVRLRTDPAAAVAALLGGPTGGGGGAGGVLGSFGRSLATLYRPQTGPRTTFADVAGIDEVKNEVTEIVDFLRDPDKYRRLGAKIPRGVLLSGPPGGGKTLLARAVAGEAQVPFFSISASEFIEAIVGVGASRVRDLFDQAKKVAPAIIFIDELDSIGRARGGAQSLGGNDEREQTLDQILTEMDGFTGAEGVVVLAATNRPEILDPALLRPGRFDRRVTVNPPDLAGRRQILAVHTRDVPLAPDVDLDAVAAATPGMVGADLANLVNEAALLGARRGHVRVSAADFADALEKIVLGTARGITLSREERERTAYHEAGHALLGMLTPGADPVRKVSIIPRGQALGVTFQAPAADRYSYTVTYLRGRIVGALGGRAAEEVVYSDISTGAESDLDQVSSIARQMAGRWGMSDAVGPLTVLPRPGRSRRWPRTRSGLPPRSSSTARPGGSSTNMVAEQSGTPLPT